MHVLLKQLQRHFRIALTAIALVGAASPSFAKGSYRCCETFDHKLSVWCYDGLFGTRCNLYGEDSKVLRPGVFPIWECQSISGSPGCDQPKPDDSGDSGDSGGGGSSADGGGYDGWVMVDGYIGMPATDFGI